MECLVKGWGRNVLFSVFFLFIVGLVLQFVGYVTPGWVVWKDSDYTLNRGVWYYRECKNDTCSSSAYAGDQTDEDISGVTRKMATYQIRTTIGLAFSIAVIIITPLGIKFLKDGKKWAIHLLILAMNLMLGGMGGTAFSACIDFGLKVKNSHDSLGAASKHESPYGVFLSGIGSTLCLTGGIVLFGLMMYACCGFKQHRKGEKKVADSYELPPKP